MGLLYLFWKRRATAAGLVVGALCLGSSCLVARADDSDQSAPYTQSSQAADPQVDLDIVNANLLAVVSMLRTKSGAQIVVAGGDQSYQPVTLTMTGSLSKVLHYVAVSAGATVTRGSDGVYVFQPAHSDGDVAGNSQSVQPEATDAAAPAPTASRPIGQMHIEKIQLKNVDPDFILTMLNDPEGYRDTNPYHSPEIKEAFSPIPGQKGYVPDISTPSSQAVSMIGSSNSEQPSVPLDNGPVGAASSMTANRATTGDTDQAQQFVTPGGGGFYPTSPFRTAAPFQNAAPGGGFPGAAGAAGPNGTQSNLRPEGVDSVIANEQDNSLLVRGDAQGIAELKQIISLLDVPPKQVQIKVEYITASVSDVNQFGISWDMIPFPGIEVGNPNNEAQAQSDFLTYAHGNLVARLFAFLSDGKGQEVSSPTITTTNNTPGAIYQNIEIPYLTSSVVTGASSTVTATTVGFLAVPTGLTVTPRVNGDNSVTLVLNPTLSVPGNAITPTSAPPVTTEGLTTIRTVADGETMVLGGLEQKADNNTRIKVPILGDLPIIGPLFRTRNESINDSELLIFVTPTVLPTPGTAASLSGAATGAGGGVSIGVTP